jgi:mRNA interferase RelE/StbE
VAEYRVELKPSARKELERLPDHVIARIMPRLETFAANPRPAGCRKLHGGHNEWRIRVGDYRVVYVIDDAHSAVRITRIRHRREAYQP